MLTILHGGGRGNFGPIARLFEVKEDVVLYVVEADLDSAGWDRYADASRQESEKHGLDIQLVPGCLWSMDDEARPFYVNHMPTSSGLFPRSQFAEEFCRRSGNGHDTMVWKDVCVPVETRQVTTVTIDTLVRDGVVASPDVVSLDIQGSEHAALIGGWNTLSESALCVLTEAEFLPMYENQPLIGDIQELMDDMGFFLAGFSTQEQWYMGTVLGRGFPAVTEAIFFRRPEFLSQEKKMKLGYIAGAFEYLGFAHKLLHDVVQNDHDEWERYLAQGGTLAQLTHDTYVSIERMLHP